jgi:hypothetical protein
MAIGRMLDARHSRRSSGENREERGEKERRKERTTVSSDELQVIFVMLR